MTLRHCQTLCLAAGILLAANRAIADPPGPVTACASDTQAGAGLTLAQALAAGGVIRFKCPAGSTIRVSGRYVLKVNTEIDGGNAVTLDAQGSFGPMLTALEHVVLRRLVIRNGTRHIVAPGPPGQVPTTGRVTAWVLAAFKDAELDHVTIQTSDSPVQVHGTAVVRDSSFVGNRGGDALTVDGHAEVERTRFTGNQRALSLVEGWVRSSTFTDQSGGAVRVGEPTGAVEIRHSTFTGTRGGPALNLSQRSDKGATRTVTVRANVFRDNDGAAVAGGVSLFDAAQEARDRGAPAAAIAALAALPPARFVFAYNRFSGNRGGRGGAVGATLAHSDGMISTGDLFVGNGTGGDGGAVVVSGGTLEMGHALFKGNHAGGRGAALAVMPDGAATVTNALIVGNVGPAGTITGRAVTLANVTIADNQAAGLVLEGAAAHVANVILAANRPADCSGVPAGAFRGGGLQSDGTCPVLAVGDAFLDAFYVPAPGSPALQSGDPAICRSASVAAVDLPFQSRMNQGKCALGAFERAPVAKLSSAADTSRPEVHADQSDDFSDDDGYQPAPQATSTPSARTSSPVALLLAAYAEYVTACVLILITLLAFLLWRARHRTTREDTAP